MLTWRLNVNEGAGQLPRRRLIEAVVSAVAVLSMQVWIDSLNIFVPFIQFLYKVLVLVSIDFAAVRHVLSSLSGQRQNRPRFALSMLYVIIFPPRG